MLLIPAPYLVGPLWLCLQLQGNLYIYFCFSTWRCPAEFWTQNPQNPFSTSGGQEKVVSSFAVPWEIESKLYSICSSENPQRKWASVTHKGNPLIYAPWVGFSSFLSCRPCSFSCASWDYLLNKPPAPRPRLRICFLEEHRLTQLYMY